MNNGIEQTQTDSHPGAAPQQAESAVAIDDFRGLVSLVQLRYGLSREEAEEQVRAFLEACR